MGPRKDRAPAWGGDARRRSERSALAPVIALPWVDSVVAAKRDRIEGLIAEGGPGVALQPIVNLRTWKTIGHEALARFGSGSPDGWFEDAAEAGRTVELETVALRNALDLLGTVPSDTFLTVNLSPEAISDPQVDALIRAAGSHRIVVELTESGANGDGADVRGVATLRAAGVRFAIDDIGNGFASLQRVLRFDPDFVKIERELVAGIDEDPKRRALVETLVAFARKTRCILIAEGIETDDELETLLRLGIRYGQGYRIGRPQIVRSPLGRGVANEWFGMPSLEPKYHSRRRRRTVVVAVAASLAITASASAATITGGGSESRAPANVTRTLR